MSRTHTDRVPPPLYAKLYAIKRLYHSVHTESWERCRRVPAFDEILRRAFKRGWIAVRMRWERCGKAMRMRLNAVGRRSERNGNAERMQWKCSWNVVRKQCDLSRNAVGTQRELCYRSKNAVRTLTNIFILRCYYVLSALLRCSIYVVGVPTACWCWTHQVGECFEHAQNNRRRKNYQQLSLVSMEFPLRCMEFSLRYVEFLWKRCENCDIF